MTMHKSMEKLRHNDWLESHALCESTARLQVEFPLVSPFSLTSCPASAVYRPWLPQTCLTRWYSGVKGLGGGETSSTTIKELYKQAVPPASLQQKTGQQGLLFFLHSKRGKFNSFISLFTSRFLHFCKSFTVSAISYDCLFSQSIWTLPSCGYF